MLRAYSMGPWALLGGCQGLGFWVQGTPEISVDPVAFASSFSGIGSKRTSSRGPTEPTY